MDVNFNSLPNTNTEIAIAAVFAVPIGLGIATTNSSDLCQLFLNLKGQESNASCGNSFSPIVIGLTTGIAVFGAGLIIGNIYAIANIVLRRHIKLY